LPPVFGRQLVDAGDEEIPLRIPGDRETVMYLPGSVITGRVDVAKEATVDPARRTGAARVTHSMRRARCSQA